MYRVGKESTPTLILHGQLDRTTPLVQAEMLHRAFRFAEVPTELVVYPGRDTSSSMPHTVPMRPIGC